MAQLPFNANDVPQDEGFKPVPAGRYLCQIISSEVKPTKAGTGTILQLTSQILEGQYNGRLIFDRLNISNPNPEAERISARKLADLILAVGMTTMQDTEELHFKPFYGKVGIRQDKTGQFDPQNTINYTPREGAEAPQQAEAPWEEKPRHTQPQIQPQRQQVQPSRPTPTANGGNPKPWQRTQTPRM